VQGGGGGGGGRMNGFRREKTAVPRRINYTQKCASHANSYNYLPVHISDMI